MKIPEAFIKEVEDLLGNESQELMEALKGDPPVSIRLNHQKVAGLTELTDLKQRDGRVIPTSNGESVPWSNTGFYLSERPVFTFDPLLHAGCYYVQEASSMFVEKAVQEAVNLIGQTDVPIKVLDLCAAPGGKSVAALSVLPANSLLVANEVNRSRAQILAENLVKWGAPNTVVTQNEPCELVPLDAFFDLLIADVPCSGEGMFRKDPRAIEEWAESSVNACATRQQSILKDCLNVLKPGGVLIYSTCTFNTVEDEAVAVWLADEMGFIPKVIPQNPTWNITGSLLDGFKQLPVNRFFPHKTKGEGFFLILFQKPLVTINDTKGNPNRLVDKRKPARNQNGGRETVRLSVTEDLRVWLKNKEDFHFFTTENAVINAIPSGLYNDVQVILDHCTTLHTGIEIGTFKGKDFIPSPVLALSTELNRTQIVAFDLDFKQSMAYLRKEAITLPAECPLGWVLVTYKQHPLGWVKNVGNRANNAWPNAWRIRSSHPFE